jgi:hypothetical protein
MLSITDLVARRLPQRRVPMLSSAPVAFDETAFLNSSSLAAYLARERKAPSGQGPAPAPDRKSNDDLDGCDVPVEKATSDEELPASEGGVA